MDAAQIQYIALTVAKAGLKTSELMLGHATVQRKEQLAHSTITQGETEMTQTIEQLTARVRELEEENARLKCRHSDA